MTILNAWNKKWPVIRITKPTETEGSGVLDSGALKSIEVGKLFDTINHAKTTIGQAVLYRSLVQPLSDLKSIQDKQAAIKELQENPELKESLESLLKQSAKDENYFHKLLFGVFLSSTGTARERSDIEGYGYAQYRRGTRFLTHFVNGVSHLNQTKSSYLTGLFSDLNQFSKTRAYSLMSDPVYITEKGIVSKMERKGFSPAIFFKPHIFKPLLITLLIASLLLINAFAPIGLFSLSPMAGIFLIPLSLVYFPIIGGFDRDSCIKPLREEFRSSEEVGNALDTLGRIDELLSLIKYSESCAEPLTMPELMTAEQHQIQLHNAKNPVLSKNDATYVGNDFSLQGEKLVLITGPNSGGKTAFCKTITQIQLLAQIGSYVPATSASLSVADKIFYQAPELSQLEDGEGRFGTELKRTRDIFLTTSPKSLVVLDELSEGTTFEEKMEMSTNVLEGFYQKSNSTLLITHNHQLVDYFIDNNMGIALQVEFTGEEPSHKLISGISRVSHAHRVAEKIGFSKDDIAAHLAKK